MELKEELLEKLRPLGEEIRFNMGDVIFREGDRADRVFVILSGHASIFKKGPGGEDVFVGLAGVGSVLGEMGIFLEGERTATVRAASNVSVLAFDGDEFLRVLSSIPELAYNALKELSKRVNNLNRRIINLTTSKLMYVIGMYLLENIRMEENPYYTPEEGKVELPIRKFATEYNMEIGKIENILNTFQKAGVLAMEEKRPIQEEDREDVLYVMSLNPDKFRSYLRSIAYV